jgi:hypothetical protein
MQAMTDHRNEHPLQVLGKNEIPSVQTLRVMVG